MLHHFTNDVRRKKLAIRCNIETSTYVAQYVASLCWDLSNSEYDVADIA